MHDLKNNYNKLLTDEIEEFSELNNNDVLKNLVHKYTRDDESFTQDNNFSDFYKTYIKNMNQELEDDHDLDLDELSSLLNIYELTLIKFSANNLLSHSKPNQIYLNKVTLISSTTKQKDINKYFFAIIIFFISLVIITSLLTIANISFENSFKLGILTLMNTVNSEMYQLSNFDFYNLSFLPKISLIVFMIIGRIELISILILFKKFLFKN